MGMDLIPIYFEGRRLNAKADEPIGVTLLRAGVLNLNYSVRLHRPRGIYCMKGRCASCLVRIDGQPNIPACRTLPSPNMRIERQNVLISSALDAHLHHFFPQKLDIHHGFTGSRWMNRAFLKATRWMTGSGVKPDIPIDLDGPSEPIFNDWPIVEVDILIVGAGPSGLAAYSVLSKHNRSVTLVERNPYVGGFWRATRRDFQAMATWEKALAETVAAVMASPTPNVVLGAEVIGYLDDTMLVFQNGQITRYRARRYGLTIGSNQNQPSFPGNDLPGVLSSEAAWIITNIYRCDLPRPLVVIDDGGSKAHFKALLEVLNPEVHINTSECAGGGDQMEVIHFWGSERSKVLVYSDCGRTRHIRCNTVVNHSERLPDNALATQFGAEQVWDVARQVYYPKVNQYFETSHPKCLACGSVCLDRGCETSYEEGIRMGHVLRTL